jgi:uncharacterized protein YgiM (DUF1202 family)
MYYLNEEGVPFYRVQKGDKLSYPLVQVGGKASNKEELREHVAASVKILARFRHSKLFSDKDLGDMTVVPDTDDGSAPYLLSLRFPPQNLPGKTLTITHPDPLGEVNIRTSPTTSSELIQKVPRGSTFTYIQIKNNWYEIQLTDSTTGWVKGDYVTINH